MEKNASLFVENITSIDDPTLFLNGKDVPMFKTIFPEGYFPEMGSYWVSKVDYVLVKEKGD